ncbi:hypothetical protein ThrDRAFT_02127 [Frankia casuarinae]|uniref:Uncharacterized protein n=1 Tax=Frankia casuarinae (strain DSM 45818 / CECT 9043 / HFP020203 / CcI3) TaxID=106370 RepID=Q2JFA3_FRACC|nr:MULTISPECIES: helix-turn-helix transcriptional regulator [Frankia]ABD10039.1 hypothetical protein Francci3_0655 [Frankia casuarinae]ETA04249.1 hypothetical protein CcI6DRAFT_00018 [Frankia sp. CcI6]EYT92169.1 hypothetical protein ThrDRAFT_02127 [Frankia casuarinae]KDA45077.1 hypothetical protein BMG523Draft_00206 [Frankia sp. BMG5.23]KEZ38247.1 hypothetical protein CEDDRAFT_00580 [Frankia sp. CeD]
MAVTVARIRAEALRLRELGWSYRRIARRLQARHHLSALVAFRLAHGWTQEEAARRWNERWPGSGPAKTGKTFSYWESWPAKGSRAPSTQVLSRLAELYLCRPGDLLDGRDYGELDEGFEGGAGPAASVGCTCAAGGTEEDGCAGLRSLADGLSSPAACEVPSAQALDAWLANLLAGWVPAA